METPVDFYEIAKSTSSQRVIKTHLPVNLLPTEMLTKSGHKMIYTIRNPKDAVVSVYHHFKNVHGYVGSFTDMLEGYLNGEIIYGSYFQHVEEYLRLSKIKQNLLLVSYEDMVTDMVKVVEQLSSFLDIPLSDTDIQKVADYVHFDKMKERKSSNFQDFAEEASSNGSGVATKFRWDDRNRFWRDLDIHSIYYIADFCERARRTRTRRKCLHRTLRSLTRR